MVSIAFFIELTISLTLTQAQAGRKGKNPDTPHPPIASEARQSMVIAREARQPMRFQSSAAVDAAASPGSLRASR
jgi:hypothetical protein